MQNDMMRKIEVVLEKERIDRYGSHKRWVIDSKGINYQNAEALIRFYNSLKNEYEQKAFQNTILECLEKVDRCNALCFFTMIQLGFKDNAIYSIKKKTIDFDILEIIKALVENDSFDDSQLRSLLIHLQNADYLVFNGAEHLRNSIINKRFDLLNKEMEAVDLEIKRDQEVVCKKITELSFEEKLAEFMKKDFTQETDENIQAGLINDFRAGFEGLLKKMAKKSKPKQVSIFQTPTKAKWVMLENI